ncbi:hypothetical protein DUPY_24160 [Duganella phyllosphaerae]|uniref:Uncharacterized protein n=1 Tax=Duganella phyllosphaerae TaxID=762836 RepID=A0A1E7WMV1_9BURK|nr:hypothetical protein DUPY_24160 [Duganella phyllosphaerae]
MPAVSATRTRTCTAPPLSGNTCSASAHCVADVGTAVSQVAPLSSETSTCSPAPSAPFSVPLMTWAATLVTRSVLLTPLSVEKAIEAPVMAGASVSMAIGALLAPTPRLPAASATALAATLTTALPPARPGCGVKVAVYTSRSALAVKLPSVPLSALISASVKPAGTSVNVKVMVAVSPTLRLLALVSMVSTGATVSTAIDARPPPAPRLPAASVYRPLARLTLAPPSWPVSVVSGVSNTV